MKNIAVLLFSLLSLLTYSQKKVEFKERDFPAKYVLKSSGDTIVSRVRNTGMVTNSKFSYYTILMKMPMVNDYGKKTIVKPEDISYLKITDPAGKTYKFISSESILNENAGLMKIIYDGSKIKVYRKFEANSYDYSVSGKNYFVEKNKGVIEISSNKKMEKYFSDYPEIVMMVDKIKNDDDLLNLLQIYNSK